MDREPFVKLAPVFKDYLWGGTKLKALYGAKEEIVAEAWLLSAHPDGESVIAEGKYKGMAFGEYLRKTGQDGPFPILIKLIDSARKLSVQVHPDDAYALKHEHDNGKSEMWLVLEAEPNAYLYVGFDREISTAEIRKRIADGTIEEVLHKLPTRAGDSVFIPAGTVHAIGEGNLILEVQQSSNATYRLYDYQRRGADGKLRPLHLDKALDVLSAGPYAAPAASEREPDEVARCAYFRVFRHAVDGNLALPVPDGSFASVICVGGEGALHRDGKTTALHFGDSVYLPAGGNPAEITGTVRIVVSYAKA